MGMHACDLRWFGQGEIMMKLEKIVKWSLVAGGFYLAYRVGKRTDEEKDQQYINSIRELYREAILG